VTMTLAGLCLMALAAEAQPARHGPPIRFSDPKKDTVSTNLNQFADKVRSNLRRLDEELSQPLEVFRLPAAESTPQPLTRPPAGPPIQSQRIRELLDKKKNWVFTAPEDDVAGLTGEEMLGVPQLDEDGRPKARTSSLEKFYQKLERDQAGPTNRASSDGLGRTLDGDARSTRAEDDESPRNPVQARILESERGLQKLFKTDSGPKYFPEIQAQTTIRDLFAPNPEPARESWEQKAQQLRLDQFRQMMQPEPPRSSGLAGGNSPAAGFTPSSLPTAGSLSSAASGPGWSQPQPASATPASPVRPTFASPLPELPRRKF
jgi:hypothetical protein